MEVGLDLKLVIDIVDDYDGKIFIEILISDDDSTMRSHLASITNSGKLPDQIPQPVFSADVSCLVKVIAKPIFAMVTTTKDQNTCNKIDALCIQRYIGYYIHKNRLKPLSNFANNAKAPVEHMFNDYTWCDVTMYWSKEVIDKLHEMDIKTLEGIDKLDGNGIMEVEDTVDVVSTQTCKDILSNLEDHEEEYFEEMYILDMEYGECDSDYYTDTYSYYDESSDESGNNGGVTDEPEMLEHNAEQGCTHAIEACIFSQDEMETLKKSELTIAVRNISSYHPCKKKHARLWANIFHH